MSTHHNAADQTVHEETQYLDLISTILETGSLECGRNGNTISVFGAMMRYSLKDGTMPLLTTKQVAWKTCFKELMWFVRGKTDNNLLVEQGVHIWDANATREFLDSRGLFTREEGDLGPIYGYQWRNWNRPYEGRDKSGLERGPSAPDQLQEIIDALKDPVGRTSRRLIMTAWNPSQLAEMALPPCHVLAQFRVRNGNRLSCSLYQRSGDVGLGVPFNIASYSFLTHILAKHCGLVADEFVHFLGDAHIYEGHVEALKTQLERDPYPFPRIEITRTHESIDDYSLDDIVFLEGSEYKHHPSIKMPLVA